MHLLDIISLPALQSLVALLTVALAFLSIIFTYKLSRPKVKIKSIKSSKLSGGHESYFSYGESGPLAVVKLSIENCSSHKTQIRNVYFYYKKKIYYAANCFTDYSESKRYPIITSTGEFPIKKDMFFAYTPFDIESFQQKDLYFTFFDIPKTDKKIFICPLFIKITGKRFPKIILNNFTYVDVDNFPFETILKDNENSVKILSTVPLKKGNKIISKKR